MHSSKIIRLYSHIFYLLIAFFSFEMNAKSCGFEISNKYDVIELPWDEEFFNSGIVNANSRKEFEEIFAKYSDNPRMINLHGMVYSNKNSCGFEENIFKAKALFEKAKNAGDYRAELQLSILILNEKISGDKGKALNFLEKYFERGINATAYYIGKAYLLGNGVAKNNDKARKYLEKSASIQENACNVSHIHGLLEGEVIHNNFDLINSRDFSTRTKWREKITKSCRILQNSFPNCPIETNIAYYLGWCHLVGMLGGVDQARAMAFFSYTAEQGDARGARPRDDIAPNLTPIQSISAANILAELNLSRTEFELDQQENESKNSDESYSGSGFFVNEESIITNEHVVKNCSKFSYSNGSDLKNAELISKDSYNDLAILKASERNNEFVKIRSFPRLGIGEKIISYGFPFSDLLSANVKVTEGIINSLAGYQNRSDLLQISAQIMPGSSGGPLLDSSGNLVAISVAGLQGEEFQNVNFGIKATALIAFLEANQIKFEEAQSQKKYDISEISKKAINFTTKIVCN